MENGLKQRIVGAIFLIGLAVIVVPVILDERSAGRTVAQIQLAKKAELPYGDRLPPAAERFATQPGFQSLKHDSVQKRAAISWALQIGSFAQLDRAYVLKNELSSHGISVYLDIAQSDRIYVYAGPYLNELEASSMLFRLEKEFGVYGFMVPLEDEQAGPAKQG